ncbi:unnamed protein product, partial [Durusdinium trenchii]
RAMNFCPFPHSLRDQAWLAVGLGCGVLLMRKLRMKEAPGRALKSSEQLKGVETGGIGWEVPFKDGTMDLEDVLLPEGSIKDVRVCNCAVVFGRTPPSVHVLLVNAKARACAALESKMILRVTRVKFPTVFWGMTCWDEAMFESVDHKKKFKQIWSNIANKVKEVEPNCLFESPEKPQLNTSPAISWVSYLRSPTRSHAEAWHKSPRLRRFNPTSPGRPCWSTWFD